MCDQAMLSERQVYHCQSKPACRFPKISEKFSVFHASIKATTVHHRPFLNCTNTVSSNTRGTYHAVSHSCHVTAVVFILRVSTVMVIEDLA